MGINFNLVYNIVQSQRNENYLLAFSLEELFFCFNNLKMQILFKMLRIVDALDFF